MKTILLLGLLPIPALSAEIRVCIVADEHVAPAVQTVARSQAAWMLGKAGVKVRWQARDCQVEIRFANGVAPKVHPAALAYAEPFADKVQPITVLYDRVRFLSERRPGFEARLLAHVLVHEIGHVLMRTDAHSDTGVMKARWTIEDYDQMTRAPLGFTASEREMMVSSAIGPRDNSSESAAAHDNRSESPATLRDQAEQPTASWKQGRESRPKDGPPPVTRARAQ